MGCKWYGADKRLDRLAAWQVGVIVFEFAKAIGKYEGEADEYSEITGVPYWEYEYRWYCSRFTVGVIENLEG